MGVGGGGGSCVSNGPHQGIVRRFWVWSLLVSALPVNIPELDDPVSVLAVALDVS